MKIVHLLLVFLFALSSLSVAADDVELTAPVRNQLETQIREMSAVGVDPDEARKMLTLMHRRQFDDETITQARQTVMQCAGENLPTGPVMSKAMEGMAKRAGESQIIAAMQTVHSRYATASRLAGSLSDDRGNNTDMTHAIADSLAAGMTNTDMAALAAQVRTQTRQQTRNEAAQMAIQTMQTARTMARLGIHSGDVTDTLCQALENRYTVQEMEQLRIRMVNQAQQASAQQIATQHAASIGKNGRISNSSTGNNGSGSGGSGGSGSSGGGSSSGGSSSGGSSSGGSSSGGSSGGGSSGGGSGGGGSGSGGSGGGGSGGGGRK